MFFYFTSPTLRKPVKAQVVLPVVDFVEQPAFKVFVLHSVDAAFEYRFLNTLADAFTHFGNTAQAPSAFAGFRVYVIADNDQHDYLRKKGM